MDISSVVFPRKLLKKFILLYKDSPCLWDRECTTYKNKQKRHDAITKLTELVQEYDSSATRVHILRKIESLRACIRREHKRVVESRHTAQSPDEIYVPQLWYYELLSFVCPDDEESRCAIKMDNSSHMVHESDAEEILGDDEPMFEQQTFPVEYDGGMVEINENPSGSKSFRNYEENDSNKSNGKRQFAEIEDEYDAIGINVAAKLRSLPSNMRILAEKLINDVLFQAQMNALNSSTVLSTSDPFKQDLS